MKTIEFLTALIEGKFLRRKSWERDEYILFCKENDSFYNADLKKYYLALNTSAEDWEIYHEMPKIQVKYFQYAFINSENSWQNSSIFYKDDADFLKKFRPYEKQVFKKIENAYIEVFE
jgi:hypothetical protein